MTSCATLVKKEKREKEETNLLMPPDVLSELEINRVQFLYDNLPDFVAYGRYTMHFMFNRSEGTFKMYKLSDTVYVKLDDNRTFVIVWDSLMNVRPTGRDVDIDVGTDTVVIRWNGNRVVLMDDLLIAYRGKGVNLRMEDYSYEPVLHPRRLIVRSMGASIIMMVDSIKPLP